ncbi:MAG: methyltransferase domain-containing protein [Candidatus Heimdallarchaeota archaeon]|nr:methyltransferase domain-containing protein [Candidatus Heimdallarchaeota archaeon]
MNQAEMTDQEKEFLHAKTYDEMINWNVRLEREIPLISKELSPGTLLDVACSSGRHSFALENHGFQSFGIDISPSMIQLANELKSENAEFEGLQATFHVFDATANDLVSQIADIRSSTDQSTYFDNAILLGNAIANTGSLDAGKRLIKNIFLLLRPGGRFFMQTVHRPSKPHYNPLRKLKNGIIVQRIMVPDPQMPDTELQDHNMVLHVNQINADTAEYESKAAENLFYMYTLAEMTKLLQTTGFGNIETYGGYANEPTTEEDGATIIWIIEKPEILIYDKTKTLFSEYANLNPDQIKANTLKIWQSAAQLQFYRCIQSYRFLFPRITSHPTYSKLDFSAISGKIVDVGCFMGTDLRQMILDGANPAQTVGIDISEEFIMLGKQLFEDTDRLETKFYVLDVSQAEVVSTKLSGLKNKVGLLHAGSFFHLLDEQALDTFLGHVSQLMLDGGIILGRTLGNHTPQQITADINSRHSRPILYHSPASLHARLEKFGFKNIEIEIADDQTPVGERSPANYHSLMFYGVYSRN